MRSKLFGLLVVLALLLGTFGTAFAQDVPLPYCGDLSKEDCAILQASREATWGVPAYKAAGAYNATLTGIPGLPASEVAVDVAVDAAFSLDDAAMAAAQAVTGKTQQDVMAMLAKDATPLVDLLAGTNADMVLTVDMTPELAAAFSAQTGGFTIPASLKVGLKLVDGVLYVDLTEVASLVAGVPAGWIGIPIADYVQAQVDAGVFTAAATQMDVSKLDPSSAAALGMSSMLMGDAKMFENYITVTRGEDVDVNGEASAVFTTKIDVGGFISSPEFAALVKQLSASGALGANAPSTADIDQVLSMLPMVGPMIFQGLEVGGSTTVGLTNNYVENSSSWFKWDLSGLMQMAAMSGQLPQGVSADGPIAIDISTSVDNTDFNADQAIEAPADAMMIPLESLTGAPAQ
jgi:hypothetical protein